MMHLKMHTLRVGWLSIVYCLDNPAVSSSVNAKRMLQLVVDHKLLIVLSKVANYSDLVDDNGRLRERRKTSQ